MTEVADHSTRHRSAFVAMTGGLVAVGSILGFVVSVLQITIAQRWKGLVPIGDHLPVMVWVLPVACVGTFALSYAFLKRWRWGRVGMLFLTMCAFAVMLFWLLSGQRSHVALPSGGTPSFVTVLRGIRTLEVVYPIASCLLCGAVAVKLMSRPLREEFQGDGSARRASKDPPKISRSQSR